MMSTNFDSVEAEILVLAIKDSDFESGKWTTADEVFLHSVSSYLLKDLYNYDYEPSIDSPFAKLVYIATKYLQDEHMLEGVLHILSYYDDYKAVGMFGFSAISMCSSSTSPVIQDLMLQCIENWKSTDFIPMLNRMNIEAKWLKEYRDDILNQIQRNEDINYERKNN